MAIRDLTHLQQMLARGGARIVGAPPVSKSPALPPLPDTGLAGLLAHVQALAEAHGWLGCHAWNPEGPDQGLHLTLVRDVIIMATVLGPGQKVTPSQQRWLAALRATGAVEVFLWTTADRGAITARLRHERHSPSHGRSICP